MLGSSSSSSRTSSFAKVSSMSFWSGPSTLASACNDAALARLSQHQYHPSDEDPMRDQMKRDWQGTLARHHCLQCKPPTVVSSSFWTASVPASMPCMPPETSSVLKSLLIIMCHEQHNKNCSRCCTHLGSSPLPLNHLGRLQPIPGRPHADKRCSQAFQYSLRMSCQWQLHKVNTVIAAQRCAARHLTDSRGPSP